MGASAADRMIVLGRLGAPWGIKGSIKVDSYTDPPAAILRYPVWHVATAAGGWETVQVLSGRPHGGGRAMVVELDGVTSPEAARQYSLRDVAQPRSALPEAAPGEYYWEDLLGCHAATPDGTELGVVSHFLEFPASSVMVVRDGARERWVPLVPRHLKKVDLGRRRVTVDWDPEF